MVIEDILKVTNGKLIYGNENIECENFSKDTRTLQKGDVYVGIRGENFDGNTLYKEAFEKGASVCILQKEDVEKIEGKAVIYVEDTIKAIGQIAAYKRSKYKIPVIAVTGSVGKTSTKDMIASVIAQQYQVLKTQGNMNNEIGLPFTILNLKEHTAMVVEMGMNHLGEIRALTNIAKPTIAVITNVGTAHIGILKSRENILKAKLEIIEGLSKEGTVIINNDNDMLHTWKEKAKIEQKIITYGIHEKSDYMPENMELQQEESKMQIKGISIKIPIAGEHFISNSLCAIAIGQKLGIPMEKIKNGIETFQLSKQRMEKAKNKLGATIINDAYNANFDSMKAAIEYLANLSDTRKIAVLGDMLELGDFSQELHEKVGEELQKKEIDVIVTVGKEAKNIAKKIENKKVYSFETNEEAIQKLKQIVQKGDTIILKASNGMKFCEIFEALMRNVKETNMKKKIAVIFGGKSTEHEVSVVSATSVIKNLNKEKYTILPIYIGKDGTWYKYEKEVEKIEIVPIGTLPTEIQKIENIVEYLQIADIVFPVLHGLYGEDGTIQGMLELLGKPYVGCKVLASCVAMDKAYTKVVLRQAGIPQVKHYYLRKEKENYCWVDTDYQGSLEEIIEKIAGNMAFPMFVKPSNSGSSVGVSKAVTKEQLIKAVELAANYDKKIIIEQGIIGKEIECAVIGNEKVEASAVGEIKAADNFYSFDAKYKKKESKTQIPAEITEEQKKKIQELAIKAFKAIDGKGLARIDFFIEKETGKIFLNEINTMPGFTTISMYPKLWEAEGISYQEVLDKLIALAEEQ